MKTSTISRRRGIAVAASLTGICLAAWGVSTLAHGQAEKSRATGDLLTAVRDGGRTTGAGGKQVVDRLAREALVADALRRGADPNVHYGTDPSVLAAAYRIVARRVAGYREWDTTFEAHVRLPVLLMAAAEGDVGMMRRLLAADADPKAHGENGETLLCLAAENRSPETARLALDLGADPNETSGAGDTPEKARWGRLPLEESFGFPEVTRLLLARGADPRRPVHGQPTLIGYLQEMSRQMDASDRTPSAPASLMWKSRFHQSLALMEAAAEKPSPLAKAR